jgi:hypothetical protein
LFLSRDNLKFVAESSEEHLLTSTAEVLRLRAPSAVSRDKCVKRSAQDDGFVARLRKTAQDDGFVARLRKTARMTPFVGGENR